MKNFANLTREQRIKKAKELRKSDLCLVLENLSEENNIAAILRTGEAFGVGKVCVVYPLGNKPRIDRGAAKGAVQWLDIEVFTSIADCLQRLKGDKFQIIGALVDPNASVLWEQSFSGKVAIVVGNEANGMSQEAQNLVDKNIYLPMLGLTESLNVSVSAGIFLYEVIRQKETS